VISPTFPGFGYLSQGPLVASPNKRWQQYLSKKSDFCQRGCGFFNKERIPTLNFGGITKEQ
jgi:hypothetical protein